MNTPKTQLYKIKLTILCGFFLASTKLEAFQETQLIDTLGTYAELKLYSGSQDSVYINHERYFGVFTKDTCSVEDHGTTITSVSGCWKRVHTNFSPRFWAIGGQSNDNLIGTVLKEVDAINCAAIAAYHAGGDTIEIDAMYIIDRPVFLTAGNTYLGTSDSCGFQRINLPKTILTDTAKVNDGKILVKNNAGFRTYQKINIANNQAYDSIAGHAPYTASVAYDLGGDTTIWLSGLNVQKEMLPGDSVSLFFPMMTSRFNDLDSIYIKNLIFEGNSAVYNLNYDWRVNQTLLIPTTTHTVIEQCRFYNIPAENMILCGATVKNCYGTNLNGSIIHISCNTFDRPTEVLYNNFSNSNIIGNSIMAHSEAGFTFSAKVQNLRLAYNQVTGIGGYGIGIFRNDDLANEITDNLLNAELETIEFELGYSHSEANVIYNNKNLQNNTDTTAQSCWLNTPLLKNAFPCAGNSSLDNPLDIGDTILISIDSILLRKSNENFVKSITPIYDKDFFDLVNIKIESPILSRFHQWNYINSSSSNKSLVFDNGHRDGLFSQGNWGYEGCSVNGNCTNISFYFEVKNIPDTIGFVDCPMKGFKVEFDGQTGSWISPIYCQNDPIYFSSERLGFPTLKGRLVNEEDINFRISPNPAYDNIIINYPNVKGFKYQIFNTLGSEIQRGILNDNRLSIDHLAKGIYVLNIDLGTKNYSTVFVKI